MTVDDLLVQLEGILRRAESHFSEAEKVADLRELELSYIGKKGFLAEISAELRNLDPEARKVVGEVLNQVRSKVVGYSDAARVVLVAKETEQRIASEAQDLSEFLVSKNDGIGSVHLISQTRAELEDVFVGMGFVVEDGPEVESEWNNFEALNIPRHHPARASQDSFFLEFGSTNSVLLRTHTSPTQIRVMSTQQPPIYAVMPGRVYRRDTADARHTPAFHQIEGLVVDRGINFAHLAGTRAELEDVFVGMGFVVDLS